MPITEAQGDEIITVLKDILSELTRIGVSADKIEDKVDDIAFNADRIDGKVGEIAFDVRASND